MYGAVGSLASSGTLGPSIWVQFPLEPLDLIVKWLWASYVRSYMLYLTKLSIPSGSVNWYRQFVGGNNAYAMMGVSDSGSC